MIRFKLNGAEREFEGDPETPLLWVLRDHVGLYGTKYGCGQALCGACTVHLNGKAIRSCVKRVRDVEGHDVTTIEGLSTRPDDVLPRPDSLDVPPQAATLHPLQQAWLEENVPQCGYCQSGQIMAAAAL